MLWIIKVECKNHKIEYGKKEDLKLFSKIQL